MSAHIKQAGVWKKANKLYVRQGGVWKEVQNAYVRQGGVWRVFHTARPPYIYSGKLNVVQYNGLYGFFKPGQAGSLSPDFAAIEWFYTDSNPPRNTYIRVARTAGWLGLMTFKGSDLRFSKYSADSTHDTWMYPPPLFNYAETGIAITLLRD